MPYKQTTWENGKTKLNASNMNNIEMGIVEVQEKLKNITENVTINFPSSLPALTVNDNTGLLYSGPYEGKLVSGEVVLQGNLNQAIPIVKGDGITFDYDSDQVVVKIGVDETRVPLLEKPVTGNYVAVWRENGKWGTQKVERDSHSSDSFVLRTPTGNINIGEPTLQTDATTKKYVDDALAGKQATLSAGTGISINNNAVAIDDTVATVGNISATFGDYVPVKSNQGAGVNWTTAQVLATSAKADTIVKRTSTGQAIVADPTADNHAATKKYVDDGIATKQNTLTAGSGISITGNTIAIDDSVAATKTYVQTAYKAGSNVTISDPDASGIRTISATGGGGGGTSYTAGTGINISGTEISVADTVAMKADITSAVSGKQDTLTAGRGISLSDSNITVNDDVATIETYQDGDYIPVCISGAWSSTGVLATNGVTADAVAIRRNTGALLVPTTPTDDNEAASKAYVDGKIGVTYSAGTGINISASNAISVDTNTIATKSDVNDVSTGVSGLSAQVTEVQTGLGTVSTKVNNLNGTHTLIENDVAYTSTLAIGDEYEFGLWAPHIQDDGTATITVGSTDIVIASISEADGALTGKITVVSTNNSGTADSGLFYTLVYAGTCKTGFVSAVEGQTLSLLPHAGGPVGTAKCSYVIKTTRTFS